LLIHEGTTILRLIDAVESAEAVAASATIEDDRAIDFIGPDRAEIYSAHLSMLSVLLSAE